MFALLLLCLTSATALKVQKPADDLDVWCKQCIEDAYGHHSDMHEVADEAGAGKWAHAAAYGEWEAGQFHAAQIECKAACDHIRVGWLDAGNWEAHAEIHDHADEQLFWNWVHTAKRMGGAHWYDWAPAPSAAK